MRHFFIFMVLLFAANVGNAEDIGDISLDVIDADMPKNVESIIRLPPPDSPAGSTPENRGAPGYRKHGAGESRRGATAIPNPSEHHHRPRREGRPTEGQRPEHIDRPDRDYRPRR